MKIRPAPDKKNRSPKAGIRSFPPANARASPHAMRINPTYGLIASKYNSISSVYLSQALGPSYLITEEHLSVLAIVVHFPSPGNSSLQIAYI